MACGCVIRCCHRIRADACRRTFVGNQEDVILLIIGNVVTLVVDCFLSFCQGFDYSVPSMYSLKMMNTTDYVTAVPKVHIAEQEKEVKRYIRDIITSGAESGRDAERSTTKKKNRKGVR